MPQADKIRIDRAPVLTLWAAVVAERLEFRPRYRPDARPSRRWAQRLRHGPHWSSRIRHLGEVALYLIVVVGISVALSFLWA